MILAKTLFNVYNINSRPITVVNYKNKRRTEQKTVFIDYS